MTFAAGVSMTKPMLETTTRCAVLCRGTECSAPAVANVTHNQRPLTFGVCKRHLPQYIASDNWTVDCYVDHEKSKIDSAAWSTLEPKGTWSIDYEDGGDVEHFLVANCVCGSTLYRRVDAAAVIEAVAP